MSVITINGGKLLNGTIRVQGAKNAGQKIIPALLTNLGEVEIQQCSCVQDNEVLMSILTRLGTKIIRKSDSIVFDTTHVHNEFIERETTVLSTGTFVFAGAMLRRFGEAKLGAPGGDQLGSRPVDFHLDAFKAMGVNIEKHGEIYHLNLTNPICTDYTFPRKTANGTVNACILASGINGVTILRNVDWDPDIENFMNVMNTFGNRIKYINGVIVIEGNAKLTTKNILTRMISDRNDAVTLICLALVCGGCIEIQNIPDGIEAAILLLREMGANMQQVGTTLIVNKSHLKNVEEVVTGAHPLLSTDFGPMLQAVMTQAKGRCIFTETVFEKRFGQVDGLIALGADIEKIRCNKYNEKYRFTDDGISSHSLRIEGSRQLKGTNLYATDIRSAASLLIAALCAEGKSCLHHAEHIYRGYERMVTRLTDIGAYINESENHG